MVRQGYGILLYKGLKKNLKQMKTSKIKDTVTKLLTIYPVLRDDDARLVVNVWNEQLLKRGINLNTEPANEILFIIANGSLNSSESITRCRRKLQEVNIDLRGAKWLERHEAEKETIEDLRNNY
jgi:hypothetical protein